MFQATDLRNNTCFLYKGEPYRVMQYKHTHLSRRGADIKVKAKNLINGAVLNLNFGSNDRFGEVNLVKKKMQFLYQDEGNFCFMDPDNFEQIGIFKKIIGEQGKFLKEGENFNILFWEDKALGLDMPPSMVFEVVNCDPGVKGDSATNIYKNAQLINGVTLKVPLFIKVGNKIKVDTRRGEYLRKVS
jgi:elongation factor P